MCYRCTICRKVSEPRQPRLVHVIHGPDSKAIAAELPVCAGCKAELDAGYPYAVLVREHQAKVAKEEAKHAKVGRAVMDASAEQPLEVPKKKLVPIWATAAKLKEQMRARQKLI